MNNETRKKSTEFKVWGAMNIAIGSHENDHDAIDNDYDYSLFISIRKGELKDLRTMAAHTANAEIIKMIENKG